MGILAAIAVPRLTQSRANASRKALLATLRTIDSAIVLSEADNNKATSINDLVDKGYLADIPSVNGATIDFKEVVVVPAGTDPVTAEIKGFRAVASITDNNVFGESENLTDQTVGDLQKRSNGLWK